MIMRDLIKNNLEGLGAKGMTMRLKRITKKVKDHGIFRSSGLVVSSGCSSCRQTLEGRIHSKNSSNWKTGRESTL